MISGLIATLAVKTGLPQKAIKIGGAVLLAGLAILAFKLWLNNYADNAVRDDRDAANVEVLTVDKDAQAAAATERATDTIEISKEEVKRNEAINQKPSSGGPDSARVRLNCERLRRQGTDTANIAACR